MKWRKKEKPRVGKIRIRKCFAWLPVELYDGYICWMENYMIEERYVDMGYDGFVERWEIIRVYQIPGEHK